MLIVSSYNLLTLSCVGVMFHVKRWGVVRRVVECYVNYWICMKFIVLGGCIICTDMLI